MGRFTYALKQGLKFALTILVGMVIAFGVGFGTLYGVDLLPLQMWAKVLMTCLLWVVEVAFFVAFTFEMSNH